MLNSYLDIFATILFVVLGYLALKYGLMWFLTESEDKNIEVKNENILSEIHKINAEATILRYQVEKGQFLDAYYNSGSAYQINDYTWAQPSGSLFADDIYNFPKVKTIPNQENILKYSCERCGGKLLVNKEKLPALQALNCISCGSSDLKEI